MSISCISRPRLEYSSGRAAGNPAYPGPDRWRLTHVRALWLDDIESLEAISQNEDARRIFLRMAALSQTGRTPSFVVEVALDGELDAATKGRLVELAQDEAFLLAVEEYLVRTNRLHWRAESPATAHASGASLRRTKRASEERWAILDSNQGPPPYQSGA